MEANLCVLRLLLHVGWLLVHILLVHIGWLLLHVCSLRDLRGSRAMRGGGGQRLEGDSGSTEADTTTEIFGNRRPSVACVLHTWTVSMVVMLRGTCTICRTSSVAGTS